MTPPRESTFDKDKISGLCCGSLTPNRLGLITMTTDTEDPIENRLAYLGWNHSGTQTKHLRRPKGTYLPSCEITPNVSSKAPIHDIGISTPAR